MKIEEYAPEINPTKNAKLKVKIALEPKLNKNTIGINVVTVLYNER